MDIFFVKHDLNALYFFVYGMDGVYPMRVKTFISWASTKLEMGMGWIPAFDQKHIWPRLFEKWIKLFTV